jgi:hypothetical protein
MKNKNHKKVVLDVSKVTYDGNSFVVTYSAKELKKKFKKLQKSLAKGEK